MAFEQVLKTYIQPSMKLIELSDHDNAANSTNTPIKVDENRPDFSQVAGKEKPFVKISGKIIVNIELLTIDESGFIPKLMLMFKDSNGEFSGPNFPKRNLMVSVFINSANNNFKPIRSDYLITKVTTISPTGRPTGAQLAKDITYVIHGELFVPRLYNNVSKSYSSMTSTDVLKKISEELGLGYVQNQFKTADSMTWINFNTSPSNFIKTVLSHSFQDEKSFFHGFISKELMITMVEVNTQLKGGDADTTFSSSTDPQKSAISQRQKDSPISSGLNEVPSVNYLTNKQSSANQPNYIYEANLISNQGKILKTEGYKKQIYYYDHLADGDESKFKDFFVVPTNTDGATEESMLIPDDEGMDEVGNKKWMNINYGNTHPRWNAARVFNAHNLNEIEKIKLRILLNGINFQVIRGMTIPILMTQSMADRMFKEAGSTEPMDKTAGGNSEETIDTQISGWYYVKEAKYVYDEKNKQRFYTELILARREWNPNKIKFTANE